MKNSEYFRREKEATAELQRLGILRKAEWWIQRNPPPKSWTGTPLEYALEEMPAFNWMTYFGA